MAAPDPRRGRILAELEAVRRTLDGAQAAAAGLLLDLLPATERCAAGARI